MEIIKSWMKDKNLHEKEYQIEGIEWCLNNEINGFEIKKKIIKGGLIAD